MNSESTDITDAFALAEERRLSSLIHDLRTPLNHVIGLSEMLLETAEAEGARGLAEGLTTVREAGIELASLLQDKDLMTMEPQPQGEYLALDDASRAAVSRVLGFADLVLSEPSNTEYAAYREDLELIRDAGRNFFELARNSSLLIRLEAARHWDQRSPVPEIVPVRKPAESGRVLIVDDEGLNREMLCRRLAREGYRASGVHSGREALHVMRSEAFDVVLLDIMMPEMSGIEVLQIMKRDEHLRHLPVIMLSALADVDRVARCIELGAEDYLPKPINAVILRARIGACLEKKRLRDQEQASLKAMHAETERLSVTLRTLADAVVTTDDWGRIVLLNEVATQLTGVANDKARGQAFGEVFRFSTRGSGDPAPSIVTEVLARKAIVESELALLGPDGRERMVFARCAPIQDAAGTMLGTVVVVRDVTEREKMAGELLRTSKLQSIGMLAGGLAHDFNNMLTAVLGNLSLLQHQHTHSPEVLASLREAEHGALRARDLTRYLLTFADGGAPMKQVLQPKVLIEASSAFALRGSNVQCEFRLPAGLWSTEADPNQLAQALSNVVLNAVEATPAGGQIIVSAENASPPIFDAPQLPYGDYLRIVVRDRGTGITKEDLGRIYDPFFTTKKQARGLGLAAAYSIIQRHEGQISVESVLDEGTTVTIYLPAVRPSVFSEELPAVIHDGPAKDQNVPSPGAASKRRALVMDDEEPIRTLVETMLSMMDYEVVGAPDGETALSLHSEAMASGRPFDLVVMDLTIPGGMGGREAIKRLREKDTGIRAIVSSGYSNDPVMANYTAHGFDAVLPKPYMMKDLMNVVTQLAHAS